MACVVEEAGEVLVAVGGLLCMAQGLEFVVQLPGEVGGWISKSSAEATACRLAVGVEPWLVVVGVAVAVWCGRGEGRVDSRDVVQEAFLEEGGGGWGRE